MAHNPEVPEHIYENPRTAMNLNLLHPPSPTAPSTYAYAPPQNAQKNVQLAELYEDLTRLERDNAALRENLKWRDTRYEDIISGQKRKISELEKENESLKGRNQFMRTASLPFPVNPDFIPPSRELKKAEDEIENLKAAIIAYEDDVRNIRRELNESQRAKGILTREVHEAAERNKRQEDEIANLSFLLNEYVRAS